MGGGGLEGEGTFSSVISATLSLGNGELLVMTMISHFILLSIRFYISIEWNRVYVLEEEGSRGLFLSQRYPWWL